VERVEGGCPRGGEEEGGGSGQRGGKGGGLQQLGGEGVGLGGGGGSHPSDRDQRAEHALPTELPTPAEKMPKDLLFP
jgi:hypothetical protein